MFSEGENNSWEGAEEVLSDTLSYSDREKTRPLSPLGRGLG